MEEVQVNFAARRSWLFSRLQCPLHRLSSCSCIAVFLFLCIQFDNASSLDYIVHILALP